MKNTSTLIAILASATLLAQPTIQFGDVPAGLTMLTAYQLTDPGNASEPSPGVDQVWDLSSATFAVAGSALMGPAAGTPYAANFPAANWSWAVTPSVGEANYTYLNLGPTGMEVVATYVPSTPNVYTDLERIMQFPFVFGTSFQDNFVSAEHTGTETWSYLGHGTLITPIGTFTDQLMVVNDDDDVLIWNASPLYPRVIADEDGVTLFGPGSTGVGEERAAALTVFPVPACTTLNVPGMTANAVWRVTDLQGRTLLTGNASDLSGSPLDIAPLAQGEYLLFVLDGNGRRSVRFQKM